MKNNPVYTTGRQDLANIIANETSGLQNSLPEQEDYEFADKLLDMINNRYN